MSTIARDLPETNEGRHKALHLADNKRLSIPAAQNPLTANTTNRLINVLADYNSKTLAINTARTAYRTGTPGKETSGDTLRMFISHFIQVFNLGVARGKYPAAHRSSYELPVDSSALPDLSKDSDLLMWANNLITGDALRIAAGGLPMANPDISEVQAALAVFHPLFTNQSNLKDTYDNAQEALDGIIPEIDKVIKKIWDELEAHYNEETPESRRENMREWGVVYITIGSSKVLSGTVTYNGAPGAGLSVRFKSGKSASICSAAGGYALTTTLMDAQKVVVEKLDPNDATVVLKSWEFEVTLNEDGDKTANFTVND